MSRMEIKGCIFARSSTVHKQFFNHFVAPVFKMATANSHHGCCAVNLHSKQSRFYLNLWVQQLPFMCNTKIVKREASHFNFLDSHILENIQIIMCAYIFPEIRMVLCV